MSQNNPKNSRAEVRRGRQFSNTHKKKDHFVESSNGL